VHVLPCKRESSRVLFRCANHRTWFSRRLPAMQPFAARRNWGRIVSVAGHGRFHFMPCSELGVLRRGAPEEIPRGWNPGWKPEEARPACLMPLAGWLKIKLRAASRCAVGAAPMDCRKAGAAQPRPIHAASTIKPAVGIGIRSRYIGRSLTALTAMVNERIASRYPLGTTG